MAFSEESGCHQQAFRTEKKAVFADELRKYKSLYVCTFVGELPGELIFKLEETNEFERFKNWLLFSVSGTIEQGDFQILSDK